MALSALLFVLTGWLLVTAGAAWLWGAPALSVGGMALILFGMFAIDTAGRRR